MLTIGKLTVLLAATILGACGGGGGATQPTNPNPPGEPQPPQTPSATAAVEMRTSDDGYGSATNSFVPSSVRITRGGTVTWSNTAGVAHTVTFDASAGAPQDIAAYSAGSASRTFGTAGTFAFRCSLHSGMNGTVTVQ